MFSCYDMKCKAMSILKIENFEKNEFFEKCSLLLAVSVQNHEDTVESYNKNVEITDIYEKIFK